MSRYGVSLMSKNFGLKGRTKKEAKAAQDESYTYTEEELQEAIRGGHSIPASILARDIRHVNGKAKP